MQVVPVNYFVYSRGLLEYVGGFSHLYSLALLFYLYILEVHLYILEVSVIYSGGHQFLDTWIKGFLFCPFKPPSNKRNVTIDILYETPNIGQLEFKKKLGVASSRGRHWPIN